MVRRGSVVNNVGKVVILRVGRRRVERVARSLLALLVGTQRRSAESFGEAHEPLTSKPNNRFHPTGVPPLLVGKVQDASG